METNKIPIKSEVKTDPENSNFDILTLKQENMDIQKEFHEELDIKLENLTEHNCIEPATVPFSNIEPEDSQDPLNDSEVPANSTSKSRTLLLWDAKNMEAAIDAMRHQEMGSRRASQFYKVPRTTLQRLAKEETEQFEINQPRETDLKSKGRHPKYANGDPFVCDICQKQFFRIDNFQRHKLTHSMEKPFVCDVCLKSFARKDYLTLHRRSHTHEKPYVCNICGQRFSYSSILKYHELTHTDNKTHICDICKKTFKRKDTLCKHKKIHTDERNFVCEFCNKTFYRSDSLALHRRRHTDEKPYECQICSKRFTQKKICDKHEQLHSGLKPHVCDICEKSFSLVYNLMLHKRTHTGEKPFYCKKCERGFTKKKFFINHKCRPVYKFEEVEINPTLNQNA